MADATELLDAGERLDAGALRALQLERLRASLRHAYENVPFYRAVLRQGRACARTTAASLADLARFPFTTKADLRENYPFGMFAVPQDRIRRIHASSGTTGRPTVVGYTEQRPVHVGRHGGPFDPRGGRPARRQGACGVRLRAVHRRSGRALRRRAARLYGHPRVRRHDGPPGPADPGLRARDHHGHARRTCSPSWTSSSARASIRAAPRCGSGIFGAEPWTEQMRREIEERFAIDAVDIYGLSEVIGPGVAQECVETKDGLHIWEDHFYPEVVDPITGEVLPDGEEGELVFTSLTKEAMPVDPLPDPGPDAAAARHGAGLPADGEGHRAQRRHGDPARGEPLPHADRGDRAADAGRRAPLPAPAHPRGPPGRPHGTGGGPAGRRPPRSGRPPRGRSRRR